MEKARDVPAEGAFWIDPTTGRVVRTLLKVSRSVAAQITVSYRLNDVLGIWVPAEMKETYDYASRHISAVATYSNFRRFQVITQESVKVLKIILGGGGGLERPAARDCRPQWRARSPASAHECGGDQPRA